MNRLTFNLVGNSVNTFNWTAPAGVSVIGVQVMQTSTLYGQIRTLEVVPNTTYTITVTSTSWTTNNPSTFGGLFSWTGGGRLSIEWTE